MAKKMLIDATHPEETRVVVADGNRVEEFDFESLNKRQLAGNIYLAKVTRVEPSLQAAFVEYGGNRHGFLAFPEIHPDYYQIPKADRDAILAEERALAEEQAAVDDAEDDDRAEAAEVESGEADDGDEAAAPRKSRSRSRGRGRARKKADASDDEAVAAGDAAGSDRDAEPDGDAAAAPSDMSDRSEVEASAGAGPEAAGDPARVATHDDDGDDAGGETSTGDDTTGDDTVTSIAESAGLEDETVSSDEHPVTEEQGPAQVETAAPEGEAVPAEPRGMETVDLGNAAEVAEAVEDDGPAPRKSRSRGRRKASDRDEAPAEGAPAAVEEAEQVRPIRMQRAKVRKYKIQEVVKVRQIMLVQVVKEERGNKGAALTTYLSLAGRYCVLMPNTARGGGISRKITNAADRKKLKEIAGEIDVPQGAGLIIRTAGAKRTKTEIKRDYEYLQRQWEQVRELTLRSVAPAPIYEEGNLVHRSIRDYYNRDIDEVIVDGAEGFRQAHDYMKLIMPSHAKNVVRHEGPQPLFAKYGVESYLSSMFNPTVQLPSGGYIVIGVTEALVAVDVNSGKATKEGSIEETALKTNLEAAEEVARQAKLRDLAGLIVIDFIDMDERKNNAAVEKRMKDALKNDRARIQVGWISSFGLMEMSRQRLRPGMLEATTQACPHCHGTGLIRSDDSLALQVLRALEEEGGRGRSREVLARLPVSVANYLMNDKREHLAMIEQRYSMAVRIEADPTLTGDVFPALEKFKTATRIVPAPVSNVVQMDTSWTPEDDVEDDVEDVEEEDAPEAPVSAPEEVSEPKPEEARAEDGDGAPKKKRRRRSRRRKSGGGENGENGENGASPEAQADAVAEAPSEGEAVAEAVPEAAPEGDAAAPPKSRSRSRVRARSKKAADAAKEVDAASEAGAASVEAPADIVPDPAPDPAPEAEAETAPEPEVPAGTAPKKRRVRARAKAPAPAAEPVTGSGEAEAPPAVDLAAADVVAGPETVATEPESTQPEPTKPEPAAEPQAVEPRAEPEPVAEEPKKPKRRGWWSLGG
jgi:ribonuclease E